ncbi:hypothetical protein D917_09439 [Trichinella nativa]|uniref:Uncharacterized protein n=1 Tax=Trichinella nativa TaxID=6335 RepID=A0A1Y3EFS6_9BILA|nr:hypothetical protein D917_09439 [Trichinella nativa]
MQTCFKSSSSSFNTLTKTHNLDLPEKTLSFALAIDCEHSKMVLRFISLKLQYDSFAFKLLNDTIVQLCALSAFEPCLKIPSEIVNCPCIDYNSQHIYDILIEQKVIDGFRLDGMMEV